MENQNLFKYANRTIEEFHIDTENVYSYWHETFKKFFRSKMATVLSIGVVGLLIFTIVYTLFSSTDPYAKSKMILDWNQPASSEHWFGTDHLGRDIFARTWYGVKTSLLLSLTVGCIDMFFGVITGLFWGYVRKADRFMTELYNIISNIPRTIILILLSYLLSPGFSTIVLGLCLTGWIKVARFIRNKVFTIRDAEYNIASRSLGTQTNKIMFKNILPFLVSIIILETAITVPYTIGSEVFLGYIGLGLPQSTISLGTLVQSGISSFQAYPSQLVYPTVILSFITVSFYLLGNKLSDVSEPKNYE
ncbi:ABC transporter permease [Acidaminobacter sp. JC074]|uniref:ABC transporter permease n=1 Tax=Acidaminobacter sp. JC074 TaxID=2530199 RepID=UPI001F0E9BC2|nr:ABC transporter permease [Acidaminobacter sp. JC074]MCH4890870.1 ABC transporter permease [Acidaminobacter sp. JC074]